MLGNFSYCNPTKLYFGENSLSNLSDELKKYGDNVVLVYGTGSIKKNGIYDDIIKILKENNKNITEIEGVIPNPTVEKLYEGIEIARNHNADFILAVGVVLFAIFQRHFPFLLIVMKILGKNILSVLKSRIVK